MFAIFSNIQSFKSISQWKWSFEVKKNHRSGTLNKLPAFQSYMFLRRVINQLKVSVQVLVHEITEHKSNRDKRILLESDSLS